MSEQKRPQTRLDVTALLEHQQWLQRLARHLVAPATADDAVQDAWVVALRRAPRDPDRARPWIARVLMNAARRRLRGDRRRERREQAAIALDEQVAQPGAAGLERLQLQRRLIALVDALEEPYRTTVVMRYFEERTARDIARALGVAEGTVRWRTHEALARLRGALDEQADGDRRAWLGPIGALAGAGTRTVLGPLLTWTAAAALVAVLGGAAALLRDRAHSRPTSRSETVSAVARTAPRPAARPLIAATALAIAARRLPPAEALIRARQAWAAACEDSAVDGLCAVPTPASGHVCPQAAGVGPRLAARSRRQPARDEALALWSEVSATTALPYEIRIQADLALAVAKLETLLAVESLTGITLDRQSTLQFDQDQQRFQAWAVDAGTRAREASWAFERLAGASEELPEVLMARARLGQTFAETARIKLAMHIPDGLTTHNREGKDEQALFCQSIARNAGNLFERARREFRYCADRARSTNPAAAGLCLRELERLPPEPPPS